MDRFMRAFPAMARGLLVLIAVLSLLLSNGAATVFADAPGIPIPINAQPLTFHSMRVTWRNTASPSSGVGACCLPGAEDETWFNLRYRKQGSPDDFSSYTYIGGGGPPDDRGVWWSNPLPVSYNQGDILSFDVDNLSPSTSYCFSARAYAEEENLLGNYQALSPWSGEVCAQTPENEIRVHGDPGIIGTAPQGPPDPKSGVAPGLGPAMQPYPDLVAVRIEGPATLKDGVAQTYQAVIRNDGSATTGLEAQLNFSGSLEAWGQPLPATAAGMNCTAIQQQTGTAFACKGGTIGAGQTATVQFQAHATKPGSGDLVVVLNPNRSLTELDYTNDIAVLKVTVQ